MHYKWIKQQIHQKKLDSSLSSESSFISNQNFVKLVI